MRLLITAAVDETLKPVNGAEVPALAITVTVLVPIGAVGEISIVIDRLFDVPADMEAVTPVPEKVTEVAPVKLEPAIVAATDAPGAPNAGVMLEITGAVVLKVNV